MGNREDLLAGAKRCLTERGYARTTARDIVSASGTNLASIGYHYGSKEALLNEALIQATREWGEELDNALRTDDLEALEPIERFETIWNRIVELFASHRQLWAANFEMFAQIEHVPEVQQALAESLKEACQGLGATFTTDNTRADAETANAVGHFYQALLNGVMAQWLVDPSSAPSGADLAKALRAITGEMRSSTS